MAADGNSVVPKRGVSIALIVAISMLVLILGLQIILSQRELLAKNLYWRPVIDKLCIVAQCKMSAWRQPDAFLPVQQAVAADPKQAGVLLVQLSFKNTSPWPQPWPQIELTLTDINDQPIGLRRFRPEQYLNLKHAADIKADQTVSVEIALQETAGKADGFSFNFY